MLSAEPLVGLKLAALAAVAGGAVLSAEPLVGLKRVCWAGRLL